MVVKRYHNRRLYDTDESRYVTIDEIAERIRKGDDIRFVDAPSGADITQHFLAQIILDGRGASRLLPEQLLYQLIRMDDDALSIFFGRYMTWALDVYSRVRGGAQTVAQYNPLAQLPLAATDALARLWGNLSGWGMPSAQPPSYGAGPGAVPPPPSPFSAAAPTAPYPGPPSPFPEPPPGSATVDTNAAVAASSAAATAASPTDPSAPQGRAAALDPAPPASEIAELRAELAAIREALKGGLGPPDLEP